jgi:hypothetical protein
MVGGMERTIVHGISSHIPKHEIPDDVVSFLPILDSSFTFNFIGNSLFILTGRQPGTIGEQKRTTF